MVKHQVLAMLIANYNWWPTMQTQASILVSILFRCDHEVIQNNRTLQLFVVEVRCLKQCATLSFNVVFKGISRHSDM